MARADLRALPVTAEALPVAGVAPATAESKLNSVAGLKLFDERVIAEAAGGALVANRSSQPEWLLNEFEIEEEMKLSLNEFSNSTLLLLKLNEDG
jgi:hypothetical protein